MQLLNQAAPENMMQNGYWNYLMISSLVLCSALFPQEIPRDEYLKFMPLKYPRLVEQTPASAALHLYGDKSDPDYQDTDPVDGIDDQRNRVLVQLAVRFAPFLVLNTTAAPMDFKAFMRGRTAFPLYVDSWDVAPEVPELVSTELIDFAAIGLGDCQNSQRPIPSGEIADSLSEYSQNYRRYNQANRDDCKLLSLLEEFHPQNPINERFHKMAAGPERDLFKVLYFDFPGKDPASWKAEYENSFTKQMPEKYQDFLKNYVHPFIVEYRTNPDRELQGYELALQYWFFYPFNDGGNNHEGDWEHINVIVSPRNRVEGYLTAEEVQAILSGGWSDQDSTDEELVIKRSEIFFHHFVMPLDFSRPNVYQPRDAWEAELRNSSPERLGARDIQKKIRYLAYVDEAESVVNTHTFAFIGADNKGLDQVLQKPGGQNRDSHGTYPFPGMYKDIGPAGATEQIQSHVDHREYLKAQAKTGRKKPPQFKRGGVVGFDQPQRLEIVPDWERVISLVHNNPEARHNWSWLVLPLRWGYPATVSPFAGIVAHAETGNLSVVGPAFNDGWNRVLGTPGYHLYEPHQLPSVFPTGVTDSFDNTLGFFNITYPVLLNLPPFDFAWRIVAYPFRSLLEKEEPVYYPKEGLPWRFVGISAGFSIQYLPEDFQALAINEQQFNEFVGRFLLHLFENGGDSTTAAISTTEFRDRAESPFWQVAFYIGDHFSSQNTLRNSHSKFGFTATFNNIPDYTYSSELNFWEYVGSIRYSLTKTALQPYLKGGYGLSWYRVENSTANGVTFDTPNSEWIRKPSLSPLKNILPNTWHLGAGFELALLKNTGKFPRGLDFAIQVEYGAFFHNLGLDLSSIPLENLRLLFPTLGDVPKAETIIRHNINLGATLSF